MTELELTVDPGGPASADRFFRAGIDLVELLHTLSETPVDWQIVDLHLGSAVARIAPPPGVAEAESALLTVVDGFRRVGQGQGPPHTWAPDAIEAARRLAPDVHEEPTLLRLVGGTDPVNHEPVMVDAGMGARLGALQPLTRKMPGAVRGRLVGVNVTHGNRASIKPVAGHVIRVAFGNDLRSPLKAALFETVEVSGLLSEDDFGRVFHVRAEEVSVVRKLTLKWTDLFGYDPDITGGRSVTQYLEAARGEA